MEYALDALRTILLEHLIPGEEIKLILSRDGLHLVSSGLNEKKKDMFSAMCATMYGAGETGFYTVNRNDLDYIAIFSDDSNLFIIDAGEQVLVAAMVSSDILAEQVLPSLEQIANEVKKLDSPMTWFQ